MSSYTHLPCMLIVLLSNGCGSGGDQKGDSNTTGIAGSTSDGSATEGSSSTAATATGSNGSGAASTSGGGTAASGGTTTGSTDATTTGGTTTGSTDATTTGATTTGSADVSTTGAGGSGNSGTTGSASAGIASISCDGVTPQRTELSMEQVATMLENKDFEFINVHIPYAGEIPGTDTHIAYTDVDAIETYLGGDHGKKTLLYCRTGPMSQIAGDELVARGYCNILDMPEGFERWHAAGYPFTE